MTVSTSGSSLVRRGVLAALVLGLTFAVSAPGAVAAPSASGDPVYPSAQQVQAAKSAASNQAGAVVAIQAQLAASNARLGAIQDAAEVAAEKYNGAQVLLAKRTAAAQDAAAQAAKATTAADAATGKVGDLAAQTYMQGGSLGGLEAFLSTGGPQQVLDRASGLAVLGTIRNQDLKDATAARSLAGVLVRQANRTKAQQLAAAQAAKAARDAAESQAIAAQAETNAIRVQQTSMTAQLAALQHTSVRLEGQRQAGLALAAQRREEARVKAAMEAKQAAARKHAQAVAAAAERAREQRAAAAAAAKARSQHRSVAAAVRRSIQSTRSHASQSAPSRHHSSPPSSSSGVAAVIAYARAQVGKWYLWGGAGPSRFDCSGLTMMAWRQAGVYLDHYTGSQYAQTRHVSVHSLQPGDLVFYGPSVAGIHHVALYIGGGMMIEAPHTGAQIRYASIWRSDLIPMGGRP